MFIRNKRSSGYFSDSDSESGTTFGTISDTTFGTISDATFGTTSGSDSGTNSGLNYGFLAFCSLFVWFCTYFFLIANNIGSGIFCNIVFSIIFCTLLLVHAYNCGNSKKK